MRIFQCMDKVFCVEFQHQISYYTLKDAYFIRSWKFKSSGRRYVLITQWLYLSDILNVVST